MRLQKARSQLRTPSGMPARIGWGGVTKHIALDGDGGGGAPNSAPRRSTSSCCSARSASSGRNHAARPPHSTARVMLRSSSSIRSTRPHSQRRASPRPQASHAEAMWCSLPAARCGSPETGCHGSACSSHTPRQDIRDTREMQCAPPNVPALLVAKCAGQQATPDPSCEG